MRVGLFFRNTIVLIVFVNYLCSVTNQIEV